MSTSNLVANSPSSAAANKAMLEDGVSGLNQLPSGVVYVSESPILTDDNSDSTLVGHPTAGTTIKNDTTNPAYIPGMCLSIRPGADGTDSFSFAGSDTPGPAVMPAGQVGWHFSFIGGETQFVPGPIYRYLPGESVPTSSLSFMRAWHGIPFRGKQVLHVDAGHGLVAGDVVFCTDGPWINELRTEWRRVEAVTARTVTLDSPLANHYVRGTIVAGNHPHDITFRNFQLKGKGGPFFLQDCYNLVLDNLDIQTEGDVSNHVYWGHIVGCGAVQMVKCRMGTVLASSSTDRMTIYDCDLYGLRTEQNAERFDIMSTRFGPYGLDTTTHCIDWRLRVCDFVNCAGVNFYDGWEVEFCRAIGTTPVIVRGAGCVVRHSSFDTYLMVQHEYQGGPTNAGRGVLLDHVTAPLIWLRSGTSGRMRNCTGDLYFDDAATQAAWGY